VSAPVFTQPAAWGWLVVAYFFFGGLAAGSFVAGALLDLFGRAEDRPAARLAYLVALPILLICPPLLILDLDQPARFWHLFFVSDGPGTFMFKLRAPLSIGSWGLLVFGALSSAAFLGAFAEERGRPAGLLFLRRGLVSKAIAFVGGLSAFFVAGYTGVLLSVTNRPIWSETPYLGALFLVSSLSAAAGLLGLLSQRRGAGASRAWLFGLEKRAAIVEALVLVLFFVSLGRGAAPLLRGPYLVLLAVSVALGAAPLLLGVRSSQGEMSGRVARISAFGAVAGSLGLRTLLVFAVEGIQRA
jgi:formate-dependent nitrite reductase membrane component NrfD